MSKPAHLHVAALRGNAQSPVTDISVHTQDQALASGQSPSHSPELHQSWAEEAREGTSCALNEPGPRSIGFPDNVSTGACLEQAIEDPFRKVATQQAEVSQRANGAPQRGKPIVSLLAR